MLSPVDVLHIDDRSWRAPRRESPMPLLPWSEAMNDDWELREDASDGADERLLNPEQSSSKGKDSLGVMPIIAFVISWALNKDY
jgi:hypothetical protein